MNPKMIRLVMMSVLLLSACVDNTNADDVETSEEFSADLPVGSVLDPPADGNWGAATTCKPIPEVEPLIDPVIVVSLDGLTLHLTDRAGTYDRVFPIGVGAMEKGKSLTPVSTQFSAGKYYTRTDERPVFDGPTPAEARWGWNQQCRMWWTSDTGKKTPVFAGLPFIRLAGNPNSSSYAFHGPVDDYTLSTGGNLRRGYVSHGCVRMSAEGIVEVFGRIQGRRAEVLIQKPVEHLEDGTAVDIDPWLLSQCTQDADCAFQGGICRQNEYTGSGFCTQACTKYCPDLRGHASSFCAPDPDGNDGFCTLKSETVRNGNCSGIDGFIETPGVQRPDHSATATVCLPGSKGWIGDRCMNDEECDVGQCTPVEGGPGGICTDSCAKYCPDKENAAGTFCVDAPASVPLSGGICVAKCYNDDHCAAGIKCERSERFNQSCVVASTCVPL